MISVTVQDHTLAVDMEGADKLWALRSHIDIPLANITGIRRDPEMARRWWAGVRGPGTRLPGVLKAGTFHQNGRRVFFDVRDPDNTVIVDLQDEHFDQLVLEVDDPDAVVTTVERSLSEEGQLGLAE
ncbi:MAG: hypothetical protein WCE80_11935 [Acidimicrobiia bacterium]